MWNPENVWFVQGRTATQWQSQELTKVSWLLVHNNFLYVYEILFGVFGDLDSGQFFFSLDITSEIQEILYNPT